MLGYRSLPCDLGAGRDGKRKEAEKSVGFVCLDPKTFRAWH